MRRRIALSCGHFVVLRWPRRQALISLAALFVPLLVSWNLGPVAFPDLSQCYERYVDGISLAFVVFNVPHFADFVLEAPTAVGSERVHHYSKIISLEAQNRVYAVSG